MYSVACCLRCYRRVTYGADSIRMKLALDNPSDYARPDRPASASPPASCSPASAVRGFPLRAIISATACAGVGRGRGRGSLRAGEGAGEGAGGLSAEGAQTGRQRGLLRGSQRTLNLPLEFTFKMTHLDGLPGPRRGDARKVSRGAGRCDEDRGAGSDRCVCDCSALALNVMPVGATPFPRWGGDRHPF